MGGFFGVIKKSKCIADLFYGTDYNSHMGACRAGMATLKENGHIVRSIHSLENAYFRPKFEGELHDFEGNAGIGVISDTDPQPILMKTRVGKYAIVTVAKFNNMGEVEQELLNKGCHLAEMSSGRSCQTELIGLLISQGKDYVDGIEQAYKKVKGSFSSLLLTEKGIIAARDYYGRTPIVIGKHPENGFAVSSESNSFHNLGYETNYFLGPGEIVLITADGIKQLRKPNDKMQLCSFLYIYYGFPTSEYEHINVEIVRRELGKYMAKRDKEIHTDLLSGIPDSGIGMALGYCEEKKIPYSRAYVKYTPTWPRSFMPTSQETRNVVARMKLIPNRKILHGKTAMFCDDSIVRGTQLQDNVKKLYSYGAKEVHIRISCPPLIYACPFINFSASKSEMELITRRVIKEIENDADTDKKLEAYTVFGTEQYNKMIEKIRMVLNADSLKFNSLEDLIYAIGLPKEQICTHCFDNSSYGHE